MRFCGDVDWTLAQKGIQFRHGAEKWIANLNASEYASILKVLGIEQNIVSKVNRGLPLMHFVAARRNSAHRDFLAKKFYKPAVRGGAFRVRMPLFVRDHLGYGLAASHKQEAFAGFYLATHAEKF